MARRVGWVAAAVVASVWLVWAPAAAAPLLGRADLSAGPTLSGREVVWAEVRSAPATGPAFSDDRRSVLIRAAGRARVVRLLPRALAPPRSYVPEEVPAAVVTSLTHVAVLRQLTTCYAVPFTVCGFNDVDVVAGPIHGRLRVLRTRHRGCGRLPLQPASLALAGDRLVFSDATERCRPSLGPARVAVLRLDAAARPIVLARTERPVDVRAAGRLVAWVPLRAPSARVVVYDLSARRIIYRVRLPRGLVVHAWDLQADGKVAVALGPDRYVGVRPRVFLATPRRRRPRPLGLRIVTTRSADAGLVFRLARDRLLVVRPTAWSAADGELALVRLSGGAREIARFSARLRQRGEAAFDGRRVAWARQRVEGYTPPCPPPPSHGLAPPAVAAQCGGDPLGPTDILVRRVAR